MKNGKIQLILLIVINILLSGCTAGTPTIITKKQIEYIHPPKIICPDLQIDTLNLRSYEFKVLPDLTTWGITQKTIENIYKNNPKTDYRYLYNHLDTPWWSVSPEDFENVDKNDIDKLTALKQAKIVIQSLKNCINNYNKTFTVLESATK